MSSPVGTAYYAVAAPLAPSFSPGPGLFVQQVTVTITSGGSTMTHHCTLTLLVVNKPEGRHDQKAAGNLRSWIIPELCSSPLLPSFDF